MDDVDRTEITRYVFDRLADPRWRQMMTVANKDGEKPVLVALRSDKVGRVLDNVMKAGGAANTVVPHLGGYVIITMEAANQSRPGKPKGNLSRDCTVGVLLEQLHLDGGGSTYSFSTDAKGTKAASAGRAELVGLAG